MTQSSIEQHTITRNARISGPRRGHYFEWGDTLDEKNGLVPAAGPWRHAYLVLALAAMVAIALAFKWAGSPHLF